MATDTSGWKQETAGTSTYNHKFSHAFGPPANKEKQKVVVTTNVGTGDFKVSATGPKRGGLEGFPVGVDIPIYSFDASANKITVLNKKYFNNMYAGSGARNETLKDLNSKTKINTLSIAVAKADTEPEQELLSQLKSYKSYKSAKNVVEIEPQTITVGPPGSNTKGSGARRGDGGGRNSGSGGGDGRNGFFNIGPNDDFFFTIGDFATYGVYDGFSLSTIQPNRSGSKKLKQGNYYRYPEGRIPNLGYDYIQITSYEYVPVGLAKPVDADGNILDVTQPLKQGSIKNYKSSSRTEEQIFQNPINIIQLPMTGGISDNSSVSWSSDTLNELNNIAAGIAQNRIMQAGTDGSNPFTSVVGAGMDVMNVANSLLSGEGGADIKKALSLYFAGQAASAPKALQRETGKMINNNMELLFNGPTLRTFQFTFKLRPRSESEAELCRGIIKALKRDMAARKSDNRMFLETPRIFNIQYIYQAQGGGIDGSDLLTMTEHPYMNKIKPCALTSFNVNYTPDGSYMTYETNGSMVGYDLQMSFQEIEPVYNTDQDEQADKDNMGF